jgi:molybdopterin converting factor small subunit
MILQVRLFARAKDVVGAAVVAVEVSDGATVADLRAALGRDFPRLSSLLERSAVAVNAEIAGVGQQLRADDEIALLPPVSGG